MSFQHPMWICTYIVECFLGFFCIHGQFQRKQIAKYCRKYHMDGMLYTLPENETERNLLNRHLIFDDRRRSLFCFVEKIGCTDMKRLMFVTVGVLPLKTIHDEWVDLKYLEKGLKRASFINKTLTDESRLLRIQNYFKFMPVSNQCALNLRVSNRSRMSKGL